MNLDISKAPYNLNDEQIEWVNNTLENMTLKEKVGQMFFLQGIVNSENLQSEIIETISPGGFLFRPGTTKEVTDAHIHVQNKSRYPMFLGGLAENGGCGVVKGGSVFGNNMLLGATNNPQNAFEIAQLTAEEASTVGTNILLEPVVDIDKNWRCSVTNIRSFGDNEELVSKMSSSYLDGLITAGMESMPRHFPGYGIDERNPTLITTVNDLNMTEWMKTYGSVYKELIEKDIKTLLVSCIALPEVVKQLKPDATDAEIKTPANLSPIIIEALLKKELKYKGLIVSDSTLTASFNSLGKREELLPQLIASGCDMFLFAKDYLEDYISILKGCKKGVITNSRLNEAVTKILAVKASMGLHEKTSVVNKDIYFNKVKSQITNSKIANEGITLVRDDEHLIPIDNNVHKNILVIYLDKSDEVLNIKGKTLKTIFNERLEHEGFNVVERNYALINNNIKYMNENITNFKETVDMVIYIANVKPSTLRNSSRINYKSVIGLDAPWFVKEVPTIFISLSSPYHMYDMPMISTFVNCYYGTESTVTRLVEKLVGKSEFKGKSPVHAHFNFYGKQENK